MIRFPELMSNSSASSREWLNESVVANLRDREFPEESYISKISHSRTIRRKNKKKNLCDIYFIFHILCEFRFLRVSTAKSLELPSA